MTFTIAIDGPAASGKGTLARRLAQHYGFSYLDTGLLYRAVGILYLEHGQPDATRMGELAQTLDIKHFEEAQLRDPDVAQAASVVAAFPEVRAALVDVQRRFAQTGAAPGAVLDGRDIGTVILPDASAKLFVTADVPTRARRRFKELTGTTLQDVQADIEARDARDRARATAPLQQACDALLLETTNLSIDEAFLEAVRFVDSKRLAFRDVCEA